MSVYKKCDSDINSFDKMLNVMDYIFIEEETSFTDINKSLNIPKATLNRILSSLVKNEYIQKNVINDKYRLGYKFIYYSETIKSRVSIINITEDILKDLADRIGETVNLGILYNNNVLNILSAKGQESALISTLIPMSPLNCSSIGKIFLAHKSDLELTNYYSKEYYEKRTINSICSLEEFKNEKEKILDMEISIDNEEYEYGLFCMAAPLKNHNGIINAAVSITGPKVRMEMKNINLIENELKEKVRMINEILVKMKYCLNY